MAKKHRNSKTLRKQEYNETDDSDVDLEPAYYDTPFVELEQSISPPKVKLNYAATAAYREGQVVTIAATLAPATVFSCVGNDLLVLDNAGIMHRVKASEVYPAQSSS